MRKLRDEFKHEFNIDVQVVLLNCIISDPDIFARCRTIVKDEYFDDQLTPTIRFILQHADQYRCLPTPDLIRAKTGQHLTPLPSANVIQQREWFLQEIERFCRYRAMENTILDGIDLLRNGEGGEVERRIKEAMTISLSSDLGTEYFKEPEQRLRRMLDKSSFVPTGWKTIDEKLYGGVSRGGLNVFCGGPGSGKSLVLQNLALNWVFDGYVVIYFSLELSEELVAMRLDAMITGKSTKQIVSNVPETALTLGIRAKKANRLFIKKLPEGSTTTNDLRSYLKEFEIQTGLKPDVIIVDYLDLMYPNSLRVDPSDLFVKDKFVSEELRALYHETNTFGSTASQLNRCVSPDTLVSEKTRGTIKIADLREGDQIIGSSGFVTVNHIFPTEKQSAYSIRTKSGKTIVCSGNHRFPTKQGLRSINEGLAVGDLLNTRNCNSN